MTNSQYCGFFAYGAGRVLPIYLPTYTLGFNEADKEEIEVFGQFNFKSY